MGINIPRGHLKKALFLFFILAVFPFSGATAEETPPHVFSAKDIPLLINISEQMIADGKPQEATELLSSLYPYSSGEDKIQAEFLLGMASAAVQDYATAEWVFRRILKNNPSLTRVRLELALVLFQQRKDEKADYHFRLVLGSKDLPAEVKNKIQFFLSQIRYRKKWDYYINIGIAPSTNINNASSAETECFEMYGGLFCRELEKRRSSIGLQGQGGIEHHIRLSPHWTVKSTLSASIADYSGSRFDTYTAGFSTGPRYLFRKGEAGIYGSASRSWYAKKRFERDLGFLASASWDAGSRVNLGLGLVHKWQEFDDYSSYDGTNTMVMPTVFYALSSSSYLMLKPAYTLLRTENTYTDRTGLSYALGFGTDLPLGISAYIEAGYGTNKNHAEGMVLENNSLILKRRFEESFNLNVRLLNRQLNFWGFTPTLNYYYSNVKSNLQNQSYDKHSVEIGVSRRF